MEVNKRRIEEKPMLVTATAAQPLKHDFLLLALIVIHFAIATALLRPLNIFQPAGLFVCGMAWVWFGMPKVTAWLIRYTPFKRVWDWAREEKKEALCSKQTP
jgi:hypothetical protein